MQLETFIEKEFNTDTIRNQIDEQYRIINRAKRQIEHLENLEQIQLSQPWYTWEGIKFKSRSYDSCNRYRDYFVGEEKYFSYEDFVKDVILHVDKDIYRSYGGDTDFYIVSPTGNDIKVTFDELEKIPLVKEYFERIQIQNQLKNAKRDLENVEFMISQHEKEILQTDKYTTTYIDGLKSKLEALNIKKQELIYCLENENEVYQQKLQLDEILKKVDEKLPKK